MKKYVCKVCGYVYDPAQGDPEHDVPPQTPWETVPAHWTCPVCGVGKEDFEPAP
jgi:rubredoxin